MSKRRESSTLYSVDMSIGEGAIGGLGIAVQDPKVHDTVGLEEAIGGLDIAVQDPNHDNTVKLEEAIGDVESQHLRDEGYCHSKCEIKIKKLKKEIEVLQMRIANIERTLRNDAPRNQDNPRIQLQAQMPEAGCNQHTCDVCGRSFRQKKNLKMHMIVHNADLRYTCEICNLTFHHPNSISRHKRKKHQ